MKRLPLFIIVFFNMFIFNLAYANVGVFTGYGQTIELIESNDIQMVSEDITIIPGRGKFLFDGGIAGMDRVEYKCKFILKNRNNKNVSIKAGFPLSTQFYGENNKTSILLSEYQFIAQEEGKIYNVSYSPFDKEKKLNKIFLWDMEFLPNEEKELLVSYSMPISFTLATTANNRKESKYSKKWYNKLEYCALEWFGYVTETGKSWYGPIEKASFRVYLKGFEKYIFNRPFAEGISSKNKEKILKRYSVWEPLVFRDTEPDVWEKDDKGYITLLFNNYKPEKDLIFSYYILFFPKTKDDLERLISRLSYDSFTKEDYEDLRDIFIEYNGEKTNNERIHEFLINQKWYGKKIQNPIPGEVLNTIEIYK
ncbi:MAG: hypothetical protein KKC46_07145 [Proteobacteria bacterium]|nr:hypothetical protein [Pseudomonadota bacterium]